MASVEDLLRAADEAERAGNGFAPPVVDPTPEELGSSPDAIAKSLRRLKLGASGLATAPDDLVFGTLSSLSAVNDAYGPRRVGRAIGRGLGLKVDPANDISATTKWLQQQQDLMHRASKRLFSAPEPETPGERIIGAGIGAPFQAVAESLDTPKTPMEKAAAIAANRAQFNAQIAAQGEIEPFGPEDLKPETIVTQAAVGPVHADKWELETLGAAGLL